MIQFKFLPSKTMKSLKAVRSLYMHAHTYICSQYFLSSFRQIRMFCITGLRVTDRLAPHQFWMSRRKLLKSSSISYCQTGIHIISFSTVGGFREKIHQ